MVRDFRKILLKITFIYWTLDKMHTLSDLIIGVKGVGSTGLFAFSATGNVHG